MSSWPIHRAIGAVFGPIVRARRLIRGPARPSWSSDFEAWTVFLRQCARAAPYLPIAYQRALVDGVVPRGHGEGVDRTPERIGSVEAVWIRPAGRAPAGTLLYLHGGGYTSGSIASHFDLARRLCLAGGFEVLLPEYRLAPEHAFPAQLEDALACYRFLLARGIAAGQIALAGDSAGGGLVLSTLLALRDAAEPLPAGAACLSAWVDLEMTGSTMRENARFDYVTHGALDGSATRFLGNASRRDPRAAPIHADLRGVPPLLLQAGSAEVLLDDSVRLAERARAAGVDVTLEVWPDMPHAWHIFAPLLPDGQRAIERVAEFANAVTSGSRTAVAATAH